MPASARFSGAFELRVGGKRQSPITLGDLKRKCSNWKYCDMRKGGGIGDVGKGQ